MFRIAGTCLILLGAILPSVPATNVDANTIVQRWMETSRRDFDAALQFGYRERIHNDAETKTYEVVLLDGSPFKHLISVDDRQLSGDAARKEQRRFDDARAKRSGESADDRAQRIADYKKDFERGHRILDQMPKAFQYTVESTQKTGAYTAYVLRAVPNKNYDPPSTDAEVLTGMQGEFWIETKSFQLIRGIARVVKPVTIDGFLATVQPGTEFEIEQKPVAKDLWLPAHFQIRSHSRVIFVFHHHIDEDRTFSQYRRASSAATATDRHGS